MVSKQLLSSAKVHITFTCLSDFVKEQVGCLGTSKKHSTHRLSTKMMPK